MKRNDITLENYQELAMQTCLAECRNKLYAMFGMNSEIFEMLAKIEGLKAKRIRGDKPEKLAKLAEEIKAEIGDVFWFTALLCELEDFCFSDLFKIAPTCKSNFSGWFALSEYFAECEKNGEEFESGKLKQYLEYHIGVLKRVCRVVGTTPLACMRSNVLKLASRAERGTLKGNGDKR